MKRVEFLGTVKSGKVCSDDASAVATRLKRWEGKRVQVSISPEPESKTLRQLGYFFSTVVPEWAKQAGYTEDEMYEALWLSYMPYRVTLNCITREDDWYRPRLSDATKEEASEFLDRCIREAALAGFEVPEPSYRG